MIPKTNKNAIWPYPLKWNREKHITTDVLILGGGIAGCWAAISSAATGVKTVLIEKGATIRSGAAGSGCDHWESAATNPCSKITPEQLTNAMIEDNGGYNNGISHYIECKEGYDRLLELEKMGGKIRDTEDEFKNAEFRDEKTKFLFAYDYENRFTLRVWGSGFKPALYKQCKRSGVNIYDRTMVTCLLTAKGKTGTKIVGAAGINGRTGEFMIVRSKATVLAMSRPARIWLFYPERPGISEFRPPQNNGDGHAMAWKAGAEFTMMEKSVRAEWSGNRSLPPYGTGNNHNTWYACSMVDAVGKEIPWVNRDGDILTSVSQRYRPAPGQKFFIKGGGESDFPSYKYKGPDTLPMEELLKKGYKLPFYADLPAMPEPERRAIWGLMVGEEGKTKIPILKAYTDAGFNPDINLLQSYGQGWQSAVFLPRERQLFGLPGGLLNDWRLRTNLDGLYAAGDQLFASNCFGHAAATGHYAGKQAARYTAKISTPVLESRQIAAEKKRILSFLNNNGKYDWKKLNKSISLIMQQYCGEIKNKQLLKTGLTRLNVLKNEKVSQIKVHNPHELIRTLEVLNILTNAELILLSCLAREASSKHLHFKRSDFPEMDPPELHKFITLRQENGRVITGNRAIDYYGDLEREYRKNK